jgi:hypothetical protein
MLLILRRSKRDVAINIKTALCKVPLFFSDFNETLNFSTDFKKKKLKYQVLSKSVQW